MTKEAQPDGDAIMDSGLAKIEAKYLAGMAERDGKGMEQATLPYRDWLMNLQEEAIDTVFYIEKLLAMDEEELARERAGDKPAKCCGVKGSVIFPSDGTC